MTLPRSCDVVVIGGGPGGSTAATLLAQQGYDVVLIEKEKHPRFVVGESLIPTFWKYAEASGVAPKIDAEGFIKKAGGTVVWNNVIRQVRFKDFGYEKSALHVERDCFDKILFDHAREEGAKVFEEVAVTSVNLDDPDQPFVLYREKDLEESQRIDCRFVIDASGQSAVIARQQGNRFLDEGFRFMSIWGYFKNSKYVGADGHAYTPEHIREIPPTTFVSNIEGWGWLWHIAMRESTSIGFVLPQADLKGLKGVDELEAFFVRRCREIPNLCQLLEDAEYIDGSFHVVRDYSYLPSQLAGPGYFLVGDSASFIDPIFSIGIVLAMYSAYLATWAIDRSFRKTGMTEASRRIYSTQFHTRLQASRALALPRYGFGADEEDRVRYSLQFETTLEQELMYVVSTLTTRSENFAEMSTNKAAPITSNKYRVIDKITF